MLEISKLSDTKLVELLKSGKVGVVPTDTVYGLVCRAADEKAVAQLYALKKREQKPGTIIAATIDQLVELGVKTRYLKAVEHFWPNPVSIIIPTGPNLAYLHLGLQSLAIRIPKIAKFLQFVRKSGPLLTTSANLPGQPTANTVEEAEAYFGDRVDFYVDGGNLSARQPSTVIRVIDDAIEIIRKGAVKIDETGKIK